MTIEVLRNLLRLLRAREYNGEFRFPCPICQPEEQAAAEFKAKLSPGTSRLFVAYCFNCCIPNDRESYHQWLYQFSRAVTVPAAALAAGLPTELVDSLWDEVTGCEQSQPHTATADFDLLHEVYSFVLDELSLLPQHEKWLLTRGLSAEWGFAAGYRSSLPYASEEISSLVYDCTQEFSFDKLMSVPGFSYQGDCLRLLTRSDAILTPCRSSKGQIVALKFRMLDSGKARMRILSSARSGGAKAVNWCHTPLGVGCRQWPELWITEGERKADVHWLLTEKPTVGVPGIGNWKTAIPVVKELAAAGATVVIALDCDGKERTAKASAALAATVASCGYPVEIAEWADAKGLDDAALQQKPVNRQPAVFQAKLDRANFPTAETERTTSLTDSQIIPWLRLRGRLLRESIPAYQPTITKLIKSGQLRMFYTPKGQVVEVAMNAGTVSGQ